MEKNFSTTLENYGISRLQWAIVPNKRKTKSAIIIGSVTSYKNCWCLGYQALSSRCIFVHYNAVMHKWQSHIFIVTVMIGHSHESSNFKKLKLDTLYNGHWGFLWSQNLLALNYKSGYFWSCTVILGHYFVLVTVSWPESHYAMYGKVKPA